MAKIRFDLPPRGGGPGETSPSDPRPGLAAQESGPGRTSTVAGALRAQDSEKSTLSYDCTTQATGDSTLDLSTSEEERIRLSSLTIRESDLTRLSTLSAKPKMQRGVTFDPQLDQPSERRATRFHRTKTTATNESTFHLDENELPTFLDESHTQTNRVSRSVSGMLFNENNAWIYRSFFNNSRWVIFAMAMGFVLGTWGYPDGNDPTCPEDGSPINSKMCEMIASLEEGRRGLYVLTSFILAGFLSSSRQLWLTRRSAYCALCGATRNLVINVTTIVPPANRKTMARWAALGYELSVLKARMLIDTDEAKDFLEKANLVVKDEWEQMVTGDRHTTVWYWVQAEAKMLRDKGEIPDIDFHTVCNAVTLSRDKANDLMSVIDRDQPYPYVSVCSLLVNFNIFFHATAMGGRLSVVVNKYGGLLALAQPAFWTDVLFLLLYVTMFSLIFDVCSVLYNPYGPRDVDIPHGVVGKGIRHLAKSLSREEDAPRSTGAGTRQSMVVDISRSEEKKLLRNFQSTSQYF